MAIPFVILGEPQFSKRASATHRGYEFAASQYFEHDNHGKKDTDEVIIAQIEEDESKFDAWKEWAAGELDRKMRLHAEGKFQPD